MKFVAAMAVDSRLSATDPHLGGLPSHPGNPGPAGEAISLAPEASTNHQGDGRAASTAAAANPLLGGTRVGSGTFAPAVVEI